MRLIALLVVLVFATLVRTSVLARHPDFSIFWKTGHRLLEGAWIYDVAADGPQCFKYPPWISPVFAPFALLPEEWAGIAWRLMQTASLGWLFLRISRPLPTRGRLAAALLLAGWMGVWNFNVMTGQISLLLTAVAYWAALTERDQQGRMDCSPAQTRALVRVSTGILALSAKVFHLFAALGWSRSWITARLLAFLAVASAALSLPALLGTPGHSPRFLAEGFFIASSSGGANLAGAHNGLPALLLRTFGLPLSDMRFQILASIPSAMLALAAYLKSAPRLAGTPERVSLALALSVSITPLAFNYSLALLFPWFALTLGRVFSVPSSPWRRAVVTVAALWVALPLPYRPLAAFLSLGAEGAKKQSDGRLVLTRNVIQRRG